MLAVDLPAPLRALYCTLALPYLAVYSSSVFQTTLRVWLPITAPHYSFPRL
jgi:hypothetical protein